MSNSPKSILFRADSSSTMGTGHIMRDLVLAQQFADAKVIFATQELAGNINHKIQEYNYPIEKLTSNNIEELNKVIKKHNIDMIVIDHYDIDYNFEKQLKTQNPKLKIFSLDDTYEKHYCDILLNHNVYADAAKYEALVPHGCRLLCGKEHTLLREEFLREKQKGRQNRNDPDHFEVFIAMGGADHQNLTVSILRVLEDFPNIFSHVVTTTANRHLDALQTYTDTHPNVTLHINTHEIARLMNRADLAIITPSVTVNEVMDLQLPFIAIMTANNQREMYEFLQQNNYSVMNKFDHGILKQKILKQKGEL